MFLEINEFQARLNNIIKKAILKSNSEQTTNSKTSKLTSNENDYIETGELEDDNLYKNKNEIGKNEFQKTMSKNKEVKEIIDDYGLDNAFDAFDTDGDGKITKAEIKELNSSCDSLKDFTKGEIKVVLKKAKEEEETLLDKIKNTFKTILGLTKNSDGTISISNTKDDSEDSATTKIKNAFTNILGLNKQQKRTVSTNFEYSLTDSQKNNLDAFKAHWEENKEKYQGVAERLKQNGLDFPPELIAAINWRESGGSFNTYLHNGQRLGQPTTCVPKGVYFEDSDQGWMDAACNAILHYGNDSSSVKPDDLDTWFEYAESYNGYGYRSHGVTSAYVWAGTDKYMGGMYVADGEFDPNCYDPRVGVAAMVKAIL